MYCVIFGIPKGIFSISSAAFMSHPIYTQEKHKDKSESPNDAKKEAAEKVQPPSSNPRNGP